MTFTHDVYHQPKPHKCNKCGYEASVSSSVGWEGIRLKDESGRISFLACPKCLEKFLRENIGEMVCK